MMKYFSKKPLDNAVVHILFGMGTGFLLTYPMVGAHPLRWGIAFLAIALFGHIWAGSQS